MIILIEENEEKAEAVIQYLQKSRNYCGGVRECLMYFSSNEYRRIVSTNVFFWKRELKWSDQGD